MNLVEQCQRQQMDIDSCVPANLETALLASGGTHLNQSDIAAMVQVRVENHRDIWAPPDNALAFLDLFFTRTGFLEGVASGLHRAKELLQTPSMAIMIWYQMLYTYVDQPVVPPDSGDEGHCAFITGFKNGLVKLSDPGRLMMKNESRFWPGRVMMTENLEAHPELPLACFPNYYLSANYLDKIWYDLVIPPKIGRFERPLVYVDLNSRR